MHKNQRGVAMMMALVTMFILAILAGELVYRGGVYSSIVFRNRDQLRANLLARSGLRLALLQLRATKKARAKAKTMGLGDNASIVDKIWQTPLILPPPSIPGLSGSDSDILNKFRDSLGLDGTVSVTILGENGKLSINQLVWPPAAAGGNNTIPGVSTGGQCVDPNTQEPIPCPAGVTPPPQTGTGGAAAPVDTTQVKQQRAEAIKKIRESFVETFNNMLQKKRDDDDDFRNKYAQVTGEQLVGNLAAWMDPDTQQDGDQRDKMDYYNRVEPSPYSPKNAPIASESEYHMVKGLDETLAKLVGDNFTIQSTSALDVNKASKLLIHSLIPELSNEILDKIDKRRTTDAEGGPFKDEKDFWAYVAQFGSYDDAQKKFKEKGIKLLDNDATYHAVITVHVDSTNTNKSWLASIGGLPPKDPLAVANPFASPQQPQAQPQPSSSTSTSTSTSVSSGTSDDDYDSLNVLYLKAE